ncbi:hypothetical protein M758_10G168800 [Ceratodon purpureus]|nr:hypothetical protein M758_10G168800 [Ceratodon purpureus]
MDGSATSERKPSFAPSEICKMDINFTSLRNASLSSGELTCSCAELCSNFKPDSFLSVQQGRGRFTLHHEEMVSDVRGQKFPFHRNR